MISFRIENIPNISDVSLSIKILAQMGAEIKMINKGPLSGFPPHQISERCRMNYLSFQGGAIISSRNARQI